MHKGVFAVTTLKRITTMTAFVIFVLINGVVYGQNSRSTLYQGDARVEIQKSKEFEFNLKRGEQLVIQAVGMDDEPISVFKVVDLQDGNVLTELNERKEFESIVTIPKNGPYKLYFFNNSSWIEKIFQIRIDIESPDGVVIASDRLVKWEETRSVSPEKKIFGEYSLDKQAGSLAYAFFELQISESEAGTAFVDVGILDVAKPWTDHLRSMKNVEIFRKDPLKAFKEGEIGSAKLGGSDSIDWKLFSVEQWNAFAKGATVESVAGSESVSAELTTVSVSAGTYVLYIEDPTGKYNREVYLEVWTHNVKTTRSMMQ
jgi:hypothetical protein